MDAVERLLRYVTVDTASSEESSAAPTTDGQWALAKLLQQEMAQLGFEKLRLEPGCYLYGQLPATPGCEGAAPVGFIAHLDTAPAFSGSGVKPQVIRGYDGGPVKLPGSGAQLSPQEFPHLAQLAGKTLVTTDGTTLLGADDKAGIAEILTMAQRLQAEGRPHGRVCVAFTPDEEVGKGAHGFDLRGFGAAVAYTVDGGAVGELEYETFNAAAAVVTVQGVSVHPGYAKGIMKNALLMAMEYNARLPQELPANTRGYEGFYHLERMSGNAAQAKLHYIVRDHDRARFEARKQTMLQAAEELNRRWGGAPVQVELSDTYYNMAEKIRPHFYLIDRARAAMEKLGVAPVITPVRGGTDGSILSYRGLPCPNLGTGGYVAHGPSEHITAEDMELCTGILLGIVDQFAQG